MKVSVIVPTYRRTQDLARCLAALDAQQRAADEVIVIARAEDEPTLALLREHPLQRAVLRVELVHQSGVVAAYNRGLESATGEIICFTDDDAAPHVDWIARLIDGFARDGAVGGIGGRDIVHQLGTILEGAQPKVGLVRWYGKAIGNHHIGVGAAREVQVLKGVNMAFRREAVQDLRFDRRLLGSGAQVHCEMQFSLDVVRRGWVLVYDPSILVDHFPAPRSDEDQRFTFNHVAFYNASYNLRLIMYEHLSPLGRYAFMAYAVLVGNRADPGFVRALTMGFASDGLALAFRKWWVGLRATRGAWQEAMR